jgi:hypothetical protein
MDSGATRTPVAVEMAEIMERLAEPGSAITVDWPFERYLDASEFTSRSALDDLWSHGPAVYRAKHITKTISTKRTPAMEFGSNVHMALLEPDEWERRLYAQKPKRPAGAVGTAKKASAEKALYDHWKVQCSDWEAGQQYDSIIVDPEDLAAIDAIVDSVKSHPTCEWAFRTSGANEQTILWHHAGTGVLLRCRLDRLLWYDNLTAVIFDVKTSPDPSPEAFSKSIHKFGYHRQAAFYADAVRALVPGAEVHCELIAVRSTAPYETDCYSLVEEPGAEDGSVHKGPLELGREQYTAALRELAHRRSTDDWMRPSQRQSVPINLPPHAYRTATP